MGKDSFNKARQYDSGNWRNDAACRETDPNLFFPVGASGPAVEQIANAKAICSNCLARVACLKYALDSHQDYGIWGGTTEEERRKILRLRRKSDTA